MSWNIYFDDIIKLFDFIKKMDNPYDYKKVNEVVFQILYVDIILLIENDITLLLSSKDLVVQEFLHEEYKRNSLYTRNKDLYRLI
jgi:hypothetical protein